jgi:uncharacterized LabA/DUF88 family protein
VSDQEDKEVLAPEVMQEVMGEFMEETVSNMLANAMKRSVKDLTDESRVENVAIYVDYDNVYWTLMNRYNHDPDHVDPNKNLFEQLWKRYPRDKVRAFRVYADFEKVPTNLTSLQRKRVQIRHVYSNDRGGDDRKNASDIEMCIDAIESTHNDPNIGCYVFVTADGDIVPILSRMMYKNKRVELLYLSAAAPKAIDITSYAHDSADLLDLLGIEEKSYDLTHYAPKALKMISDWHANFASNRSKWLGGGWLKEQIQTNLALPGDQASQLIELLEVNKYVEQESRETDSGIKRSYKLTMKGTGLVDTGKKEAASSEK